MPTTRRRTSRATTRRVGSTARRRPSTARRRSTTAFGTRATARRRRRTTTGTLSKTREQLYREAKRLKIPGRSKMRRAQLVRALNNYR